MQPLSLRRMKQQQQQQQQQQRLSGNSSKGGDSPSNQSLGEWHQFEKTTLRNPSASSPSSPRAKETRSQEREEGCNEATFRVASARSYSVVSARSSDVAVTASAELPPTLAAPDARDGLVSVLPAAVEESAGARNICQSATREAMKSRSGNCNTNIKTKSGTITHQGRPSRLARTVPPLHVSSRSNPGVRSLASTLPFSVDGGSARRSARQLVERAAMCRREQRRRELYAWNTEQRLRQQNTDAEDAV